MFQTRNAYYLRISSNVVLPLYLYLDERHLDWMSDRLLQYMLTDLRPLIVSKLQAEAEDNLATGSSASKKGAVDVKRGDSYQFAYFLRKTEPHSVLVKSRTFAAAPPQIKPIQPPPKPQDHNKRKGKRKPTTGAGTPDTGRKKRKTKGKARPEESDEEDSAMSTGEDSDGFMPYGPVIPKPAPRRSARTKKSTVGVHEGEGDAPRHSSDDTEMLSIPEARNSIAPPELPVDDAQMIVLEQESQNRVPSVAVVKKEVRDTPLDGLPIASHAVASYVELDIEEEEAKPKPLLRLSYQGFNILGHCLCVVAEPWPPIRAASRASSIAPVFSNASRALSIAPPDFMPTEASHRGRTPLFLPDPDRGRSETPAPLLLPRVPLFDSAPEVESEEEDGLLNFSQSLNYAVDVRGGLEDDDEMDGAVFFGDADEAREF